MSINAKIKKAVEQSAKAAKHLTTLGMKVNVLLDSGEVRETTLTCLPWQLGHGVWVAKIEGVSGGYDCSRITPALETEAANG